MSWKDRAHPQAGGAEVVNEELAKRLAADGHEVIFFVSGFKGGVRELRTDGYKIVRLGNRYTVYWQAYRYYKRHLQGWPDLVIDEVNTIPFMAKYYVKERNILFAHMLCRQIWFYELIFPLSLIGYLIEPLYLWMLRDRQVITVSNSTKQDLIKAGFTPNNINIISEGIEIEPVHDPKAIKKFQDPTLLSLGSIRPMKRTHDQIKAFELAKAQIPALKLKIAGSANSRYGRKVLNLAKASPYKDDIEYLGKVTDPQKLQLLQQSHLIMVTSIKEGWGLIVTEAASQGTPAGGYNVDGLRDSIKDGETGWLTNQATPQELSKLIIQVLSDNPTYAQVQKQAWEWSKNINFDRSYGEFESVL